MPIAVCHGNPNATSLNTSFTVDSQIPKIIHQSWKSRGVPTRQRAWQEHHCERGFTGWMALCTYPSGGPSTRRVVADSLGDAWAARTILIGCVMARWASEL